MMANKLLRRLLTGALAVALGTGSMAICAGVIADSVTDFSGVQGQNEWFYGFYQGTFASPGFQQMSAFDSGNWYVNNGVVWTSLEDVGGHPNGFTTSGGRTSVDQWAVRR